MNIIDFWQFYITLLQAASSPPGTATRADFGTYARCLLNYDTRIGTADGNILYSRSVMNESNNSPSVCAGEGWSRWIFK
jgi:hypothetical protein